MSHSIIKEARIKEYNVTPTDIPIA